MIKTESVGGSDLQTITTSNISTYKYLNIVIPELTDDTDIFTLKMFELYRGYEDTINQIINERERYDNTTDPIFDIYKELLRIFDLYKSINGNNPDVSNALLATCLWYYHKNFGGDDAEPNLFTDEIEDDKKNVKTKINYDKIVNFLIKRYCVISYKGELYIYQNNQYYNGIGAKERIEKDILQILESVGYSHHSKIKDVIADLVYKIRIATTKFKEFPFNQRAKNYIPVMNGVVVRKDLNVLLPSSPAWGFLYSLPVKFDKNADTTEIMSFLTSLVTTEEDAQLLIQIVAQGLLQDEGYETCYLMTGDGKNGKSTLINLNRRFIGRGNYSTVSLQDLLENRFAKAELDGKLMNVYPDLPKEALKATGILKALTGGDEIDGERKFGQRFKIVNKAVLCFSANEAPLVTDSSFAFWRRWEIIKFPHVFELDPTFQSKLFTDENLSGYLNLVIAKMSDMEINGITKTKNVEEAMNAWMRSSDNTLMFIDSMIEKSPKDYILRDDVRKKYNEYCEDKLLIKLSDNKLYKSLENHGGISGRSTINGKRPYIFKGLKYKNVKDEPDLIINEESVVPVEIQVDKFQQKL